MTQPPAKKRQFKPGVGMPSSQVRFCFDDEETTRVLPLLPKSAEGAASGERASSRPDAAPEPRQAFIPQSLPLLDAGESPQQPIWLATTLHLRVLPGSWRRRSSQRLRLVLASCGLFVLLLVGWLAFLRSSVPEVVLYQPQGQDYDQSLGGEGLVYPQRQLVLSLPFSGKVDAVLVKVGDAVSAGQAVLRLDPLELSVQLKLARDELTAAESYLQEVMTSGNATVVAQARQRYALARSRYEAMQARSSSLLSENCLVAPLRGVVAAVNVVAGQSFSANASLLTISDQSRVIVHAKLPLKALGLVHVGQAAEVFTVAGPTPTLSGTVLTIVPRADPQTDTFEVWVVLDNRSGILLPGMSVFVRIAVKGSALGLPRLAVLDLDLAPAVFVVKQERAYLRSVHVIARSFTRIFIDLGLRRGELVVLVGLADLRDGQEVRVVGIEKG
ncbi:efflux RND transporter periplasmic adaptor subunit [Thermogemmatispora onikobensis]|uniref:efflux RND transporter periplasmic adaptor subunit n=1 Tax=Thermogemmatispora onikobensis TaxID=732234 RepID=UPI0008539C81|nr:efflux RND transporter periplasmic adaptor subunit [Thermogemmatispora onikobensis]